ncbi:tyrosine-type recombinase/integrase [Pseudonocardia sp. WMMC193]|uniref:tyrosine-type recombinase/integrase n=1 Tax=Pseudonocardia sp. WMMC193 TaxID=2911965 RepID=UPI001F032966|nr:tyrosine-type recombinase/integrase [Pseudonocardia sp. WMMC193]MCF7548505.1 tyrosine-type recombinase/integrase [Pseudonocardia sp. WMMC193]
MTRPLRSVPPAPPAPADPLAALTAAVAAGQITVEQLQALGQLAATITGSTAPTTGATALRAELGDQEVIARYFGSPNVRGWRPETRRVRHAQLTKISRELGAPFTSATEEDVLAWAERLDGKPETLSSYVSAIKVLFRWMSTKARPRLRLDDPTVILDRPRVPEATPRPIASDQFDLALACAVSDPVMYAWLGLMGCCGFRCCEIAWFRGTDVEPIPGGGALLHIEGKGGKKRTVPAGKHLMRVLAPFVDRAGAGPVFPRPSDGGPHTPGRVSTKVNGFLAELRIPATAHQLRHRWGTDYHELDPDLFRQAKLMGHASVVTTARYTAVSPAEAARHVEELTQRRLGRGGTQ